MGAHERQPDLHQRPDPAGRRRGRDPGLPRRSRPGDRAVRHRRVGQQRASSAAPIRKVSGYEAACLLAFGLAALLAALVLVGQAVARYASAAVAELLVLRAVGLTRRQAAASAALAPGPGRGRRRHARRGRRDRRLQLDADRRRLPLRNRSPGISADWLVLGTGWAAAVLLVLAATAAIAWTALRAGPPALARRSPAVAAAARAGLPVPAIVGARFALEPGRGRAAVPVRPAIAGAVAGVLGVLAALTFSAGISDAVAQPGAVRADLAAGDLLRRGRPGLRPGGRGVPGRGGRPRRHRVPRRAHRRRPVRPRLDRELHLRPGGRQSGFPWC